MLELFDPGCHEALTVATWSPDLARQAIERICAAAEAEFDEREGRLAAFAALRGAGHVDAGLVRTVLLPDPDTDLRIERRALETLSATAAHAKFDAPEGDVALVNWHVLVDKERIAAWLAKGDKPLVQDCHGAPGIACRFAGVPRSVPWDRLLRAAGELTWHAGPLAKGPSLRHGTSGSAIACLKLWRRFADPIWLDRARLLTLHAAAQVEVARTRHGRGRNSLWTGDMGVACVLWNCIAGDDRFPTLDHF
jgi:hypothetical protein